VSELSGSASELCPLTRATGGPLHWAIGVSLVNSGGAFGSCHVTNRLPSGEGTPSHEEEAGAEEPEGGGGLRSAGEEHAGDFLDDLLFPAEQEDLGGGDLEDLIPPGFDEDAVEIIDGLGEAFANLPPPAEQAGENDEEPFGDGSGEEEEEDESLATMHAVEPQESRAGTTQVSLQRGVGVA